MGRRIALADPRFDGNERKYVLDCLDSTWISGSGPYVERFEAAWAEYCGVEHAVAVSNGTAALHLALLAVGVGPGDEVIVPDLTFVATANAVTYCGATPVFADVDPVTWTIDSIEASIRVTPYTRVILPVHLYGCPAEMNEIRSMAAAIHVSVIEDAAQAHGATYRGQRIGGIGDATAWSFHAAKLLTTGEGGMVTTNDGDIADRIRLFRSHGMDPERRYWHPVVGYNYRMTNIQAAIGLAQIEQFERWIGPRAAILDWYDKALSNTDIQLPVAPKASINVCWLYSVLLPSTVDRDAVIRDLDENGIESRPFFHPLHTLPPYKKDVNEWPVATDLARRGLSLPATDTLTRDDVGRVCETLREAMEVCRVSR